MALNLVVLQGNLTRDPELKRIEKADTSVVNFGLAVNNYYKKGKDDWGNNPVFIEVELWGATATRFAEKMNKGDGVIINGALAMDSWKTEDENRTKLKIRGNSFEKLYKPDFNGDGGASKDSGESLMAGADVDGGDDIPF